jgi:VanZ family protein
MIKEFEEVIRQTTDVLKCSSEEKCEIELELQDHLYSAYEYYVASGVDKHEAVERVLTDFGHTETISLQFQQVVSPLYGWLKKLSWVGFFMYSFVVLWKVIIERVIVRVSEYLRADGPQHLAYVYSNAGSLEGKQFFDFSLWQSNVNFKPFEMIVFYAKGDRVNPDIALNNLLGNILLLLPLGVLLPFLFYKCKSLLTVIAIAFCTSLLVEMLQFCLQIGMADIDDVLLNTIGAGVGYFIARGIFYMLSWRIKWKQFSQLK